MTVQEALLGINQLLDEEAGGIKEAPPHNAEPFTRMLLRLFDGTAELARDQMQKFLRGSGSAPSDFVNRGWVVEKKKVFYLVSPHEMAQGWMGKKRKGMTSDYDQAMFFVGACFEGSGVNASDTLNNANFKPHPALGALLTWFKTHGADSQTRNAAIMATQLYRTWEAKNQPKVEAMLPFMLDEEEA
jgi:putative DNA methylase